MNHEADEREELCEIHELPVCNMRRFEMIKYSFRQDEEYVVVKEDEYDDLFKLTVGTDSANITRKRSNPDKHENGKKCTRAGDLIAEVSSKWSTQCQTWSTGQPQEDKNPQISYLSLIVKPISLQVLKWITPLVLLL
ncbi:hypothetical protein Tco_0322141 [Tanacetum coccineum]